MSKSELSFACVRLLNSWSNTEEKSDLVVISDMDIEVSLVYVHLMAKVYNRMITSHFYKDQLAVVFNEYIPFNIIIVIVRGNTSVLYSDHYKAHACNYELKCIQINISFHLSIYSN